MDGSYALLAAVRRKELPTRLVIAAILTVAAWFIAPSAWPLVWLAMVVASQWIDHRIHRRVTAEPDRATVATWVVSTSATSAVYTALSVYLWISGGETGRLLAVLLAAGSLLHVTIHMHHVRVLLAAAAAPHAAVFIALPLSSIVQGQATMWAIVLGVGLYVAHLIVAFRQASSTTRQIQDERNRAEEANKAKSDFLATISHEIRTPMNAIVSAANLLRRSRLNKAQREQVEMLTDANDVLLSLLNDVLDLSKIEAGKMTLECADIDLPRTLEGLQRLWRPRAMAKGIDLRLELPEDAPRMVALDPLRLKQILSNLISNAVKFTHQGAVTIRLAVRSGEAGETLVFEIADTGSGIAPETVQRLFGAFEQGDAGTTRKHGGSGLGLAISRRLAALMGGSLDAESELGAGSTFRLTLPFMAGDEPADVVPESESETGGDALHGLRVLVAEDHPVNQRVLELLLAPLGCRLSFCEDGQKAVELAGVQEFDAILMDMQMPILDGLEATKRIKAGFGVNAATPVVALTANALEHHRAAWAEVGVHDFVSKPIEPSQLMAALADAANQAADRRAA